MNLLRDVVITGIGAISPIGIGVDAYAASLRKPRSGVEMLPLLQNTDWPVRFGASVREFDPKQYIQPRKSIKVMCREIQTGYAVCMMAMEHAQLVPNTLDPDRFGVTFASELMYGDIDEMSDVIQRCMVDRKFVYSRFGENFSSAIFPLWMLKYLPNMTACHVAIALDARGHNNSIVQGDVSSLLAFSEAISVIQRGWADIMIAGGSSSRLRLTPMVYRGDANLSHRNDDPAAASRPFDLDRDGMVNGEGAAALILESRDHAVRRGARIWAQVEGFCHRSSARDHRHQPRSHSVQLAIEGALRASGRTVDEIGHVNAHGASTRDGDCWEATAIHRVLGNVPVTAPKSFFGNTGAAGGLLEMVASLIGLTSGEIPVTLNYSRPDPDCPIHVVHRQPLACQKPAALVLNHSTTGQAAAVVIAREP